MALLQLGLNQHLAFSMIMGQVSALYILLQRQLTSHSLTKTFAQEVSNVALPVHFPVTLGGLNLVLSLPWKFSYEPIGDITFSTLTHKDCKESFLVLHKVKWC